MRRSMKTRKKNDDIQLLRDERKRNLKMLNGTKVFNKSNLLCEYNNYTNKLSSFWKICLKKKNIDLCSKSLLEVNELFTNRNKEEENDELKKVDWDLYSVPIYDNHIHVSALMTTEELKRYMEKYHVSGSKITINKMNTLVDEKNILGDHKCTDIFSFSNFNDKYYIGHKSDSRPKSSLPNLRNCFLKVNEQTPSRKKLKSVNTNNRSLNIYDMGKFNCSEPHYANLTRLISNTRKNQNIIMDLRLSIYGTPNGLDLLVDWFFKNNLDKLTNVNWYIQIPRVPQYLYRDGLNSTDDKFKAIMEWFDNCFEPILSAYLNKDKRKMKFLSLVKGFDSVDNEGEPDISYYNNLETQINNSQIKKRLDANNNPLTYSMYIFIMWKYISHLNYVVKGIRPSFKFKPHSGELGCSHHLLTTYLFCDSICHGINLIDSNSSKKDNIVDVIKRNKNNVLLYLYVKDQVGCALAPISNNYLCRKYNCLHLDLLFNLGLNMSLGTDDPLMFHLTNNPIIEEFSMAKTFYNFSLYDMMELVNNSYIIGDSKYRLKLNKRAKLRKKLLKLL